MPGRICTICSNPQRAEIDRAAIAGASYRAIAGQFGVSRIALLRHKADHLLAELVKAQQAEEVTQATDLLSMVTERDAKAWALSQAAEADGDRKTAGQMLRISLVSLELLARLRGELDERAVVNVLVMPDYLEARTVLLRALQPYAEARVAAAAALQQLEAQSGHSE
jgi:glycine cleavage system pyridoxal-binding protein P